MLTTLLKWLVKLTLRVFFKRFEIRHQDRIPDQGPMIVVANHPNTLMDPSIVGVSLKQKPFFLAKSTLFGSRFSNWLLRRLRAIPVYRQQDSQSGQVANDEMFSACYAKLEEGGSLLIFPEGVSVQERRVQKIKTGAARIALGAEGRHNFELGVKILVVGLNYSDPSRFRSNILVNVAPIIEVADFRKEYEEQPRLAVRSLTEKIGEVLRQQVIDIETKEEDELLTKIEAVYSSKFLQELGLPPNERSQFVASREFKEALHFFNHQKSDWVHELRVNLDAYFKNLEQLQLKDKQLAPSQNRRSIIGDGIKRLVYLLLGFPIYLYGLVNNYIPYILPSQVVKLAKQHPVYTASIKMVSGMLSFGLFYGLQLALMQYWGQSWLLTFCYVLSLPLSGFFCLQYWQRLIDTQHQWTLFSLFYQKNTLLNRLISQRQTIITQLDQARQEFLSK